MLGKRTKAGLKQRAADRIEHTVDAAGVAFLERRAPVCIAVIEHQVCPELADMAHFCIASRQCNDGAAQSMGKLHRCRAHPAGRTCDEQGVIRLITAAIDQAVICRQEIQDQRGCVLRGDPIRHRDAVCRLDDGVFGKAAAELPACDPLPFRKSGNACSQRLDPPDDLAAWNERQGRLDLVQTAHHQRIDEPQRRGLDAQKDVTGPGTPTAHSSSAERLTAPS